MKRLALITSASRSLGKEIVIALSKKFSVGIHYFEGEERAKEILRRIKKEGGHGRVIRGDLSTEKGARDFVLEVRKNFGDPDILINNFGPIILKNLLDTDLDDWLYILQTNLLTPFILIKEFLPSMREKKWGRIINIGFSESSKPRAFKRIIPYAISKNALLTLTLSIAKMEKNSGVTCNMVSPYVLEEGIFPESGKDAKRIPFEKVTSLILHLCEDEASNINGENFMIKD